MIMIKIKSNVVKDMPEYGDRHLKKVWNTVHMIRFGMSPNRNWITNSKKICRHRCKHEQNTLKSRTELNMDWDMSDTQTIRHGHCLEICPMSEAQVNTQMVGDQFCLQQPFMSTGVKCS